MTDTQYATPEELRASYDSIAAKFDPVIQLCLNAAAEVIDGFCNWGVSFIADDPATTRLISGSGKGVLYIPPATAVTQIEVRDSPTSTTWTPVDTATWMPFRGDAKRPNFNDTPYTALMLSGSTFPSSNTFPLVRITAKWGLSAEVLPNVKLVTIAQASRWLKRGQSAWADTLASGDLGMLMFRKEIDPDVAMMLKNARLVRPSI